MTIVEYRVGVLKTFKRKNTKNELAVSMLKIRDSLLNDKVGDKEKVKQIRAIIDLPLM